MAKIHKKIRHHLKTRENSYLSAGMVFAVIFLILSAAFYVTRGIVPATSELTFTERSSVEKYIGSVIPASCNSGSEDCQAGVGTATPTCENGGLSGEDCCFSPNEWNGSACVEPTVCYDTDNSQSYTDSDGCTEVTASWTSWSCTDTTSGFYADSVSYEYDSSACSCPTGYSGTYPNCVAPQVPLPTCDDPEANNYGAAAACTYSCPSGYTGTYPNCVAPQVPLPTCDDPEANNYGQSGSCTYDDPTPTGPDLTAGSISPTSAQPGASVTLSATITNQGDTSTGSSFNNFIQVATAANGGGTISDLAPVSVNALGAGASATTSRAYTFSSAGTYSVRACADKSNSSSSGTISESNEGNNCGVWTNIAVGSDPAISNQAVNYPDITFICTNATGYSVVRNEGGFSKSGSTTSGATVTVKINTEGNYTLSCTKSGYTPATAVVSYFVPVLSMDGLLLTANPRTVNNNKNTTLSWSVVNPGPACGLRAEVVCSGTCTSEQLTASSSINSTLKNGKTDDNDPYGASRNIQTAVKNVAPENNPTGYKALGKKTLLMTYTTDFILDCGGSILKKVRVVVSNENEG